MKRFLLLSVCLVLVGALSAQAELLGPLPVASDGPVTVTAVGTSFDANLDKVVFSVSSITGGSYVAGIEGVFTAVGGGIVVYSLADTVRGQGGVVGPESWIAEDYQTGSLSNGNPAYLGTQIGTDPTSGFGEYSSLADAWYSISTADMPRATGTADQTVLAVLFVTKSTTNLIFGDESDPFHSSQIGIYGPGAFNEHFMISPSR